MIIEEVLDDFFDFILEDIQVCFVFVVDCDCCFMVVFDEIVV